MLQPQFKPHSIQQVLLRLFQVFYPLCKQICSCERLEGGSDHHRLPQVIPGRSPYGSWDPRRCLRCAVVGNSGNLRGAGYGVAIDGHDYIMR